MIIPLVCQWRLSFVLSWITYIILQSTCIRSCLCYLYGVFVGYSL